MRTAAARHFAKAIAPVTDDGRDTDDLTRATAPRLRLRASATNDRDLRWRQRYARTYTYNDDAFYQECRTTVDPAGVIAGALIGGLLGNAAGRGGGRGGRTVAGVVAARWARR